MDTLTTPAADQPAVAPVRLPKTPFKAPLSNPAQTDAAAVARWRDDGLPERVAAAGAGKPRYVLHDGPPYANGDVHMGHALNKVLKDFVLRSRRAMGFDATLTPGWDCHGLPVEWKVEERFRAEGRDKRAVPVLEFRRACRDYAAHWVERQKAGFQRFGVLANWDTPYLTMAPEADAATVGELQRLVKAGLLYRALRPVLWSVPEQTALADAEVEYVEERYTSLFVRFPLRFSKATEAQGTSLVCWTTTPWSLPGNKAVACAPDAEYGVYELLETGEGNARLMVGERLVLARALAPELLAKFGASAWDEVEVLTGADLVGSVCRHPLDVFGYVHEVPVLAAAFVETGSGTGFVHVAPGLGPDDHKLGLAHGLPVEETVGADGRYVATVPHFAGAVVVGPDGKRGDADARVLEALEQPGMVGMTVATWTAKHETAHSWRSKAPLVYRATPQWFVRMDGVPAGDGTGEGGAGEGGLRAAALRALEDVEFLPAEGRTRLTAMVAGRPDWCVSRQRAWGVPLGLFVHRASGAVLADEDVLARVRQAFAEEGSDAWYARPAAWFLGPERDPADYEQVMDVLDVWFESGATHAWVLEGRLGAGTVADLYLEGSDQHRGWFQSSLLECAATRGRAPYKALLTHGFVLDAKGRKMAKSLGNVVDPTEVADRYGADALRLWVALSNTTTDVRYSPKTLDLAQDALKKLRNTLRYALGNLAAETVGPDDLAGAAEAERWVLARLNAVGRELRAAAERCDFSAMLRALQVFCAEDLSAFWFDLRKDSLYCDPAHAARRRGVVATLDQVFEHLVRWLAVLAPFTADEAWRLRHPEGPSVHELPWPAPNPAWDDAEVETRWALVRQSRAAVMTALDAAKLAGVLKANPEAHATVRLPDPGALAGLPADDLAQACGVSAVTLEAATDGAVSATVALAEGERCDRCWQVLPEVGQSPQHVCGRCAAA